jgi:hypothetical protein
MRSILSSLAGRTRLFKSYPAMNCWTTVTTSLRDQNAYLSDDRIRRSSLLYLELLQGPAKSEAPGVSDDGAQSETPTCPTTVSDEAPCYIWSCSKVQRSRKLPEFQMTGRSQRRRLVRRPCPTKLLAISGAAPRTSEVGSFRKFRRRGAVGSTDLLRRSSGAFYS